MYNNVIGRTVPAFSERRFLMKTRIVALLLVAAIACSAFAGCEGHQTDADDPTQGGTITFAEPTYKSFYVDGMELKLPDRFQREDSNGNIGFFDGTYAVFLTREAFTVYPYLQDMSLEEYGNDILNASGIDAALEVIDGLYCFEYEAYSLDKTTKHNYFAVLFKSNKACWVVQFAAPFWNASPMRSKFISWAKMIKIRD
jgi:hypothetical protein